MNTFVKEFKEFAVRGNVVDLAIGVVIGTAFGKIVSSLVSDIVMPPIGVLTGGVDFSNLSFVIKEGGEGVASVTLNYGVFINTIIDFVIVAFAIFLVVKQMNRLKKAPLPPETSEKECPYCISKVPLKAKKCKFCTADI